MRIFTLPYAGGNQYSYWFLRKRIINEKVQIESLEYPGRGKRLKEPFANNIFEMVEDILDQIFRRLETNEEYMIYGHSLGALIGYLVCCKIETLEKVKPTKLIISGRKAPEINDKKKISTLSKNEFWDKIKEMGGVPEELLLNRELRDFFEPILLSDFKNLEEFQFEKSNLLSIPIDVMYGSNEGIDECDVDGWRNKSKKDVKIYRLDGDHFFIFNCKELLLDYFNCNADNLILEKYIN